MRLVVAGRVDRLGARLSNLLCAWRFAQRSNAEMVVQWDHLDMVSGQYSYDPATLFDVSQIQTDTGIRFYKGFTELAADPLYSALAESGLALDSDRQFSPTIAHADSERFTVRYGQTSPVLWSDDTPERHQADISLLFKKLLWNDEVLNALREVEKRINITQATAIHVRRGDIISFLSRSIEEFATRNIPINFAYRYVPLNAYLACIENEAPSGPLAFFSEDETTVEELCHNYPGRVVDGRSILEPLRLSEPQRALVEFMLISRSRIVIGGGSQFCQLPSKLGGKECINPLRYSSAASTIADVTRLIASGDNRDEKVAMVLDECAKSFRRIGMKADYNALVDAASQFRPGVARASGL